MSVFMYVPVRACAYVWVYVYVFLYYKMGRRDPHVLERFNYIEAGMITGCIAE